MQLKYCVFRILLLFVLTRSTFIAGQNAEEQLAKSSLMKEPDLAGNIQTQLIYSTPTSLFSYRISGLTDDKISLTNFQMVHKERGYFIDNFDLSVQDNLIMIGKKELYGLPMAGTNQNFLGIKGKKKINGIDLTNAEFVVDWKDRNIYAFSDKKIIMHQLIRPHIRRDFHSATEVNNMVIDQNNNMLAWINNKNNIMKATKDGSNIVTVITEESPIECMHFDPVSMRFFYIVKSRSVAVVYSIDYDAQLQKNREVSFPVNSKNSKITSMVKYSDFVYFALKIQEDVSISYQLCRLKLRSSEPMAVLVNGKKAITAMRLAYQYKQTNLCVDSSNRCPYMCAHVKEDAVVCVCPNNVKECAMPTTIQTTTVEQKTTNSPSPNLGDKMKLVWIIVGVALPICVGLVSYAAYIYLYDNKEVDDDDDDITNTTSSLEQAESDAKTGDAKTGDAKIDAKTGDAKLDANKAESNTDCNLGPKSDVKGCENSAISSGTGISGPDTSMVESIVKKSKELYKSAIDKISKTLSMRKKGKKKNKKLMSETDNSVKLYRRKGPISTSEIVIPKHELTDEQRDKILKDKVRLEILAKKLKLDQLKKPQRLEVKGEVCEVIGKVEPAENKKRKRKRKRSAQNQQPAEVSESTGKVNNNNNEDRTDKSEKNDNSTKNAPKETRLAKRTEELRQMEF